jgi:Na+/melibiose symporter-like transporter
MSAEIEILRDELGMYKTLFSICLVAFFSLVGYFFANIRTIELGLFVFPLIGGVALSVAWILGWSSMRDKIAKMRKEDRKCLRRR